MWSINVRKKTMVLALLVTEDSSGVNPTLGVGLINLSAL